MYRLFSGDNRERRLKFERGGKKPNSTERERKCWNEFQILGIGLFDKPLKPLNCPGSFSNNTRMTRVSGMSNVSRVP